MPWRGCRSSSALGPLVGKESKIIQPPGEETPPPDSLPIFPRHLEKRATSHSGSRSFTTTVLSFLLLFLQTPSHKADKGQSRTELHRIINLELNETFRDFKLVLFTLWMTKQASEELDTQTATGRPVTQNALWAKAFWPLNQCTYHTPGFALRSPLIG